MTLRQRVKLIELKREIEWAFIGASKVTRQQLSSFGDTELLRAISSLKEAIEREDGSVAFDVICAWHDHGIVGAVKAALMP